MELMVIYIDELSEGMIGTIDYMKWYCSITVALLPAFCIDKFFFKIKQIQ